MNFKSNALTDKWVVSVGGKILVTLFVLGMFGLGTYWFCPKPDFYRYTTYSKAFLDDEQKLLRLTLAQDDRYRLYQQFDDISPYLINATLLYEDQHFYRHPGVNFAALLRAFWSTYIKRDRRLGASTVTMQVARLHWRLNSSTVAGKLQQILRALQLNRHYSKQQILQAYFNLAPYGQNIEGVAAASLVYFNKTPDRLTWPEAMTLSVIPQNPNKRNPATAQGYENLQVARKVLFQRWRETYPDNSLQTAFMEMPLAVRPLKQLPFAAPHFTNHLLATLSPWDSGITATTLNLDLQNKISAHLQSYVEQRSDEGIHNAAALLVNYQTYEIKAMVGSANFFDSAISGQVNGTNAKRSPGSTLKPFVYGMAMDEGLIHPMSMLRDAQKRFGGFTPENFDRKFLGPVFAKTALIESRNVPAVDLQARLKSRSFHEFLKQAEVSALKDASHYGLALALGGGEVSMLELASLYTALANLGEFKPLTTVVNQPPTTAKRLLSAEASYLVLDILRENPRPNNRQAHINSSFRFNYKNDVAWKTGTSWAFRDAWAIGISGPYVLAVWVGNFDGSGNAALVGRTAAGPLLFSLFSAIYPDQAWRLATAHNTESLNIKKIEVCAASGDLPSKHCPRTTPAWFIPGVSPIKVSTIHRAIPIDTATCLRACEVIDGKTTDKVFEFWPSDFLQLFQQAGISLKTPPDFLPECQLDRKSVSGQKPRVLSPLATIEYALQSNKANATIPFQAAVDTDVDTLYWFVDGDFAGSSKREEVLHWPANSGDFLVTVVDDSGRAGSVPIRVKMVH